MTEIERENMTRKFNNLPAVVYRDEVERLIKEAARREREEILKIVDDLANRYPDADYYPEQYIKQAQQSYASNIAQAIRARSESES